MEGGVLLAVLGGILLLGVLWLVVNYNRFASVRQHLRESWSDIDVELKRRYDLIPNLVNVVKGYAAHERSTLEDVIALRNRAAANQGPASSQAADESALMLGMKRLFVVVEAYPALRADTHFRGLQAELANTEDRIAASRRFYNANVREMAVLCESFPTNLVASMFGFEQAEYFELDSAAERIVPRVQFGG
jgi:LemA protein